MATSRIGGTFAPPLDDAKLDEYEQLASAAPVQISEIMLLLIKMLREFFKTPASKENGRPHPSGRRGAFIVPLEEDEKARMFDLIPWTQELDMYGQLFESLPTGAKEGATIQAIDPAGFEYKKPELVIENESAKALRDACFHLLWFARELDLDREPITSDQLG